MECGDSESSLENGMDAGAQPGKRHMLLLEIKEHSPGMLPGCATKEAAGYKGHHVPLACHPPARPQPHFSMLNIGLL